MSNHEQPKMLQLKVVGVSQNDLVAGLKEALRCVEQGQFNISLESDHHHCFRTECDVSTNFSDSELLPKQLVARYNANEHPIYTNSKWAKAMVAGATPKPYWEWTASQIQEAAQEAEANINERIKQLVAKNTKEQAK